MTPRPPTTRLPGRKVGMLIPFLALLGGATAIAAAARLGSSSSSGAATSALPSIAPFPPAPGRIEPVRTTHPEILEVLTTVPGTAALIAPHEEPKVPNEPTSPESPTTLPLAPETAAPVAGQCVDIDIVHDAFPADSAELDPAVIEQLRPHAAVLLANPGPIDVIGHTDRRLTDFPGHNQGLSEARAVAVVEALVELGVPRDRLLPAGRADREPIDDGDSEDAMAKNRRVQVRSACNI